jgi:hypothetical protein
MKYVLLSLLLAGELLATGTQDSETNVNSRYTVETVVVSGDGWSTSPAVDRDHKISSGSPAGLLVGSPFSFGDGKFPAPPSNRLRLPKRVVPTPGDFDTWRSRPNLQNR